MAKEILGETEINSFPLRHDGANLETPKRTPYDTLYENRKPPLWRRIFGLGWKYEKAANFQIRKSWRATIIADENMSDTILKSRVDEDGRPLPNPTAEQIGNHN